MMFGRSFLYGPLRAGEDDGPTSGAGTTGNENPKKKTASEKADALLKTKPVKEFAAAMEDAKKRIEAVLKPHEKFAESTVRVQQATEKLVKSGGDFYGKFAPGGAYSGALQNIIKDSQDFYGNAKAGVEAIEAMAIGMKAFVGISSEWQRNIAKTTMHMGQLGFKVDDVAKALDNQAMGFGTSEKGLNKLALTMAKVSNTLFISPTKLMGDFDIAQQNFAHNAADTLKIFISLEEQSRKTGVSFEKMAGQFGGQMDTFAGVSAMAGKLNAVLGSSVFNPLQLLNMNEAERASAIRAGIQRSPMLAGKDINDLKKFEILSLSKQLGMTALETRKFLMDDGLKKYNDSPRAQMRDEIDKRKKDTGGLEGLEKTNQELVRMEDTLRNLRYSSEQLAIDASKLAGDALGGTLTHVLEKILGIPEKIIEQLDGRSADQAKVIMDRVTGRLTDQQLSQFDKEGGANELMKVLWEASNLARDPLNKGAAPGTESRTFLTDPAVSGEENQQMIAAIAQYLPNFFEKFDLKTLTGQTLQAGMGVMVQAMTGENGVKASVDNLRESIDANTASQSTGGATAPANAPAPAHWQQMYTPPPSPWIPNGFGQ